MRTSRNSEFVAVLAYAILFLFFLQLLTDFISGIYAFGLLGTSLPMELAAVVLFLAPFLLLLFRRGLPTTLLIVLGELVLVSRAVEVFLPTRIQLLVAGLGVGLFLFLFPALLWDRGQKRDGRAGPLLAAGLLLAAALSILLRTLGSTMDLSNEGMFRAITWLLALGGALLLPRVFRRQPEESAVEEADAKEAGWGKSVTLGLGIASVFLLLYFAFAAPAVISRWTGTDYLLVLFVVLAVLAIFAWLAAAGQRLLGSLSPRVILILTAVWTFFLTLTLLANHTALPKEAAAYPLADSGTGPLGSVAVLGMLLLFPVLFLDFGLLVEETILGRPALNRLGLGFGLASLFMLLMILGNVFTSVWAYIDPILEPVSRNRFWHVHFIAGLVLTLSLLAVRGRVTSTPTSRTTGRVAAGLVTFLGLVSAAAALWLSPRPAEPAPAVTVRVAGYNIHQGYDEAGQRSHHEQCAVLRAIGADIIALSENDTARVAGGNFDIVRFLGECLDMQAYNAPKTGVGTFGYALLSRYPIEGAEVYHLFSGPGFASPRNPEKKSSGDQVAVIKAQVRAGGEPLTIFVNHFDSYPPREQPQGFTDLARGLERVVAIGDYNCEPGTECVAIITEALVHCADKAGNPALADGEIDHIFVSPDLGCPAFWYVENEASDHPAVIAEIGW